MVSGADQMAASCVRLLVKRDARSILISNRSLDLAIRWADQQQCHPKECQGSVREHARNVYACHGVFTGVSAAAVVFDFR